MAKPNQEAIDTFISITDVAFQKLTEHRGDIPYEPLRQSRQAGPAASAANNVQDYNDIEEEMIRAAIQASKMEAEGLSNPLPEERPSRLEDDDDIAKAVTMSLKSAEEEGLRNQGYKASTSDVGASDVAAAQGPLKTQALNGRLAAPSSPFEDDSDDVDEQPLVRHRPRRVASGSLAPSNARSRSPEGENTVVNPVDGGNGFPSEWGGISSEEHDEAVMLEATMFGGIPDTGYNHLPFLPPQPRPPSPSLTAQRLIREQQDDEYLASLQADRDKAEARLLEEEAARKAFLEEEQKKEEEAQRKFEEEQELERQLAAKEASLPKEPQAGEENAITLLVPVVIACVIFGICFGEVDGTQILSKSKLEKCEKTSDSGNLNCSTKIVLNLAVPSGSSGGEASIVAEIVEVEDNSSTNMQTVRIPPVITVNKSAAYALYDLTYIRDVPYKPQEFYVITRKCEPDAGSDIVQICERLRDEKGNVLDQTQPTCCPCGPQRRMPSSCGDIFDKMIKGKANTAHCLRFPGDWFHVFGIGQRSLGFSIRVELKTGTRVSEVIIGPENRTATANDNFLKVNLIGDFGGYTNIPSFEDFYLVIPREAAAEGQPGSLGGNYSMWMLLERVRFTVDGLECNKIGVGYDAFNTQPNFCSSPYWSCLHNQLWNFREADINRIDRHQLPLYGLEGKFERINQHPNAGPHSFSIGVTETLNSNLMIELRADDIEYVFQRSPGKIINIAIPTFEALTQFGVAAVTTKNTGEVEASYSLTFDCSKGVAFVEEQYFIIKPKAVTTRSFKLYPTKDQATKYICAAILKDSQFKEVDRAECQFSTTATILDNGTQVTNPFQIPETRPKGFFNSIRMIWTKLVNGLLDFITGDTCRNKCSSFFDFGCHIQYVCLSWMVMFGLLLALFPTTCVLLWLLHQKGVFDPFYDWWEDHFDPEHQRLLPTRENAIKRHHHHPHPHHNHHHRHGVKTQNHQRRTHKHHHHGQEDDVSQKMLERNHNESHYYQQLHRVHKDSKQKQRRRPRDVHMERRRRERLRAS